jgi:ribonuclease III
MVRARAAKPGPLPEAAVALAEALGLAPDSPHLEEALTHPSYANEHGLSVHNQRLEFLGDAVLDLCVTELLFTRFPDANEGVLTRLRAQLVNTEQLASWARQRGLEAALLLGRGADAGGLRASDNVLADLLEAVIASVYLDVGCEAAQALCAQVVGERLDELVTSDVLDPKTELQQQVQALGVAAPTYEVVDSGGPAHARWFTVRVRLGGVWGAQATGRSKRAAEREAARLTLEDATWRTLLPATAAAGPSA